MLMCKQMILTILVVTVAFGAEPELEHVSVLLGPSADGAFMFGYRIGPPGLMLEGLSPVHFGRRNPFIIPGSEEEDYKVKQRSDYRYRNRETVGHYLE